MVQSCAWGLDDMRVFMPHTDLKCVSECFIVTQALYCIRFGQPFHWNGGHSFVVENKTLIKYICFLAAEKKKKKKVKGDKQYSLKGDKKEEEEDRKTSRVTERQAVAPRVANMPYTLIDKAETPAYNFIGPMVHLL